MIPAVAITGLILAGGRGARMGHVDKGLQLFNGLPLAAHAIARLAPQVGPLALNVNRSQAEYAAFGLPLWPDLLSGFAGPLAGLQAGLSLCATPYLLSVPCDSPLLPRDLAARLSAALEDADTDLALAVTDGDKDGDGNHSRPQRHPVFCLMKTALLPHLNDYLHGGGRKMENWMDTLASIDVHFNDRTAFSNINTLQQLQQLEQHPQHSQHSP
jgi:molybdopterin-guanine dinucleotide biosynthesis protein A